jgi:hypothetical protein
VNIGNTSAGAVGIASGNGITLTNVSGKTIALVGAAGTINIGNDAAANTINIGNAAAAQTVVVGTTNTTSTTTIKGGTGGIIITPTSGNVSMAPATSSTASATTTVTMNNRVGCATFTGFTTASGSSQSFTITNSNVLTTSCVLVTVANLNASTNGAQMSLVGVTQAAGSIVVNTKNNGSGALGTGDNVLINFWILS